MAIKSSSVETIEVPQLETEQTQVWIIGTTPIILCRMSEKAKHELLAPEKKSAAQKASSLKHDPVLEFRASPYTISDDTAPTYLSITGASIKKAMASAALDLQSASVKKAQIGRLSWVEGEYVSLYGKPQLHMAVVRMADINHTPDIRTRAILSTWAVDVTVTYVKPMLKQQAILNLLQAAGLTNGLGEWRQQKGSGSFGQFRLATSADDALLADIKKDGRAVQIAAMKDAEPYDDKTRETMEWFEAERRRRGFAAVA